MAEQADAYVAKCAWSKNFQLKLRFRNQFCYLDASETGKEGYFPIGRLRHFDIDRLSLAFYSYGNGTYQPCVFNNGDWFGRLEEAIDVCSVYLN